MVSGLMPYPECRPSRLKWVGKIPSHWEEKRAKYYFREVDERSATGDEELLLVSHVTGVTPRTQKNVTMFKAESYIGHKVCQPGDLVINTMWAWMAAMGIAKQAGITSPSYGVYRPLRSSDYVPEYVDYLLRTKAYASEYFCRSTGIRSSRLRLYPDDFLDIPIVCPPRDEQRAMLAYLETKILEIHRFIRNKERLIELLQEQKQAIISHAVTRGIDPDVRLKPSGIDWIGDVPEHWRVYRLKNIAEVVLGKMLKTKPSEGDSLKPYLRSANIQWLKPSIHDVAQMWFSESEMKTYRVWTDDILVSEGGEAGRACIWSSEIPECYIQNSVHKVTTRKDIRPHFLLYQFLAFGKMGRFESIVNRVSIAHLTREKLVDVTFITPPLEEQDRILKHIDTESAPIDVAIERTRRQIDLIREYRTRLIADVVTGKVDVRGILVEAVPEGEAREEFAESREI